MLIFKADARVSHLQATDFIGQQNASANLNNIAIKVPFQLAVYMIPRATNCVVHNYPLIIQPMTLCSL